MPNDCLNAIEITPFEGNMEKFEAFRKTLNTANGDKTVVFFSMHQTRPQPENIANRYKWANENWGCKWDVYECDNTENEPELIFISCYTAWTPPSRWAEWTAREFGVTITIDYEESGMDLRGKITATPDHFKDEEVDASENNDDESEGEDDLPPLEKKGITADGIEVKQEALMQRTPDGGVMFKF